MATPTYEVKIKDEETSSTEDVPSTEEAPTEEVSTEPSTPKEVVKEPTDDKSVIDKIGTALGFSKEEEQALPNTPEELQATIDERVTEALASKEKDQEKEVETVKQDQTKRVDAIIMSWHSEYTQLAKMGKAPAIKDADDSEDTGVKARRELILGVGKIISEDRKNGINRTPSLSEVMLNNPRVLGGVPGADLPISGNTIAREEPASYSNKEIKGKSYQQIASEQ